MESRLQTTRNWLFLFFTRLIIDLIKLENIRMWQKFLVLTLLCALSTLILGGCANKRDRVSQSSQLFETDIRADGSKRFVVSMFYAKEKSGKGQGKRGQNGGEGGGRKEGGGRGQGQRGQDDRQSRTQENNTMGVSSQGQQSDSDDDKREDIIVFLETKIAETAYCRNGYIELDYSQMREKTELKGECQESASDQDKQRWQ